MGEGVEVLGQDCPHIHTDGRQCIAFILTLLTPNSVNY